MAAKNGLQLLLESFADLTDHRVDRTRYHNLIDVVMIAVCGAICGCDSWEDLPRYAMSKRDWLKRFLELPNGIPSADTFARVFQRLNPSEFMGCLSSIVSMLRGDEKSDMVSIDGQTLCGSGDQKTGRHPLHLVRAWATNYRLVLGQQACAEKSNEITAIPELLKVIDLEGCIVTIDAMGCQTAIADAIVGRGADYILAVKDNQPTLHQEIREAFEAALNDACAGRPPAFRKYVERQKKRGREEERQYYIMSVNGSSVLGRWRAAKSIGMVIRQRTIHGIEQIEAHYYIASIPVSVRKFARAVRGHWSIENQLHWSLDVVFAQDASRIRKGYSPEIASFLRQLALMILQRDTQLKGSIRCKRKQAGWDNRALEALLAQFTAI